MAVDIGDTVIVAPVLVPVTGVVQPASVYHFHDAPVPREPPVTLSDDETPEQTLAGVAVAPVGAMDATLTARCAYPDVSLPEVFDTITK